MLSKILTVLLLIVAMGCAATGKTSATGEAPRMTKEELKAKLGDPRVAILDVRAGRDWNSGVEKIAGAVREDPTAFDQWAAKYPKEKTLVLYCAWPDEGTSASLALKLMNAGYKKVYALKGGWNEWVNAGYPVVPK